MAVCKGAEEQKKPPKLTKKSKNLDVYLRFFNFLTFFRIISTAVNYLKYLQMINLVKYYGDTEQLLYTDKGKNSIPV